MLHVFCMSKTHYTLNIDFRNTCILFPHIKAVNYFIFNILSHLMNLNVAAGWCCANHRKYTNYF